MSPVTGDLRALVDSELTDILAARELPLYRIMGYHLGRTDAEGDLRHSEIRDRTHGVLSLLSCRAAGGEINAALPVAAAVELVHKFCEIHDDVQGGNPKRNDRDAVWWVWGPAQAINAGDGMHALARLAIFRLPERGVSSVKAFRAVQLLDEGSLRTCEGRFLDIEAQERINLSVAAYLDMAALKTGALASCAMKLGGIIATDDEGVVNALGTSGSKIGIALQIRADLRELWPGDHGSPAPSPEVMNKKKLLPVVYALEKATTAEKRRMGEIYFKRVLEPDDVAKLRGVIEELGARSECERLITRYREEAMDSLNVSGISGQGRVQIEEFVDSLLI